MLEFKGTHNKIKALSWLLLSQYPGLGYVPIAGRVGTSPASMSVLLKRWCQWGYLVRSGVKGSYLYSITDKALEWLNKHLAEMPLDSWLADLPPESHPYFNKVFGIWAQQMGRG
jgi:DNA-binding IclR family transcriptional regulator